MPLTTQAFLRFLREQASKAGRLYLLGDLFEAWAGDDDIDDPYNRTVIDALRALHDAGVALFWLAGNRDFLAGRDFMAASGAEPLPDPSVITLAGRRIALAHGDAQCTDDTDYIAFRQNVRQAAWQQQFLAMPLAQRKAIIARLRDGSRQAQRGKSYEIMDVNQAAIEALMQATASTALIHGHTHRPGCHRHSSPEGSRVRCVLPDWDCDIPAPRGGWMALDADGSLQRIGLDGNVLERC